MNQDEGHVVTLKHYNQGGYLRGTTECIARKTKVLLIFPSTYQETDRFYVVLDNQPDQWILRTKHKHSDQLRYGDEFTLQHKSSRRYLNSFAAEKSENTKQGLMCLSNSEQWFFMQTANTQDIHITNKTNVRIFNLADRQTLHSHYNKYYFYKVSNYREVTSFKERDENDYWQIGLETSMQNQLVENKIELLRSNQHGSKQMNMQLIFDNFDQSYIYIVSTKQYIDIDENESIRLHNTKIRPFQIIPIKSKEFLLGQFFYIQIHEKYLSRGQNQKLSLNQFPNALSIWAIEQKE